MSTDQPRSTAKLCSAVLAVAAASLLALIAATPALAQLKGDFTVFAQCQVKNPEVTTCVHAVNGSGELQIGTVTIPITKAIVLQGGIAVDPGTGQEKFVGAHNGETLSKTPQAVPGGLLSVVASKGLPKALKEVFEKLVSEGLTGVTATMELLGLPTLNLPNLLFEEGVALALPIRVRLSNPFLGNECYIGSQANPVMLELTTGVTNPPSPNTPIAGSAGTIEFEDDFQIAVIDAYSLVDNSFAAPGATGCGGINSAFVDPAVDAMIGLPSAAGHNKAILKGTMQVAEAATVIDQMK